jgi:hypothetical protein
MTFYWSLRKQNVPQAKEGFATAALNRCCLAVLGLASFPWRTIFYNKWNLPFKN